MKKINQKCYDCAQTGKDFRERRNPVLPECYDLKVCGRRRSYYKRHEINKQRQLDAHRYLKYKDDKCAICQADELMEVHHIIPQCRGGLDARFNLITLCHSCHKTISTYYRIIGWQ
jgi:5-methylcytosine-specific restriction endonuclease McrA